MNYYYDLPQELINKIEDFVVIIEEEQKEEQKMRRWDLWFWKHKIRLVNDVFSFACDMDDIQSCIEEGLTFSDIGAIYNDDNQNRSKLTFAGMEHVYWGDSGMGLAGMSHRLKNPIFTE